MHELTRDITANLDSGVNTIAVFLDLAKAFDTVSHTELLNILERYGVRGIVLDVFESYLNDRQQFVKVGESLSQPVTVRIGVPQGTILGPILFNVYINTLCDLKIGGRVLSYADDTVLLFSGNTWQEVRHLLINGFKKIKICLDNLKLTLNIKKTNYIAFSLTGANRPEFNTINIDTMPDPIKEVGSAKYLGIMIDSNLKWAEHTRYLCNKLRFFIHKFYLLKEILNRKLLIMTYKSLVEPLLRYGILVWGGAYNTHLEALKIIQNCIVKIIFSKPRLYPTHLLYDNNICSIRVIYISTLCLFIYIHDDKQDKLKHHYQTRAIANEHLSVPPSKRNINQRFVTYLAPKYFNLIPKKIRDIKNRKKFIKLCREYIVLYPNVFTLI